MELSETPYFLPVPVYLSLETSSINVSNSGRTTFRRSYLGTPRGDFLVLASLGGLGALTTFPRDV